MVCSIVKNADYLDFCPNKCIKNAILRRMILTVQIKDLAEYHDRSLEAVTRSQVRSRDNHNESGIRACKRCL